MVKKKQCISLTFFFFLSSYFLYSKRRKTLFNYTQERKNLEVFFFKRTIFFLLELGGGNLANNRNIRFVRRSIVTCIIFVELFCNIRSSATMFFFLFACNNSETLHNNYACPSKHAYRYSKYSSVDFRL